MNSILADTHIQKKRWRWAERAEAEFKQNLKKLDADEEITAKETEEIHIGVYGPTQVGKTTLILRLMGIPQQFVGQLSGWLRGKRDLGFSATVTATQFKKSEDDFFHLFAPETGWIHNLTGEGLENALAEIRKSVAIQGEISTDLLIIKIAKRFFVEKEEPGKLTLVDLPGIQSADPTEQLQVKQCVRRWLPLCELTLLVDDASQLAALTKIQDENVRDWWDEPERFRIVPTHALSLESVRDAVGSGLDRNALRDHYVDELHFMMKDKITESTLQSMIFPVDFGKSLDILERANPSFYKNAFPVMEDLLEELKRDLLIQKPATLHFKRLTSLYKIIERKKREDLDRIEHEVKQAKKRLKANESAKLSFSKRLSQLEKDIAAETEVLEEWVSSAEKLLETLKGYKIAKTISLAFDDASGAMKASAINQAADQFRLQVERDVEGMLASLRKSINEVLPGRSIKTPSTAKRIEQDDSLVDFYFFKNSFLEKLGTVKDSATSWGHSYKRSGVKIAEAAFTEMKAELERLQKKYRIQQDELQAKKRFHEKKDPLLEKTIEALGKRQELINEEWQQDLAHCDSLLYYFQKHALDHYQLLKTQLIYGSTLEKWEAQHLLYFFKEDSQMTIGYLAGKEQERSEHQGKTESGG